LSACRTEADLRTYISEFILPNIKDAELDKLLEFYPQDPTQGSPYDTGDQNAFTPQFKRIASIMGDYAFQAPRRFFLKNISGKQNTWSFCMYFPWYWPLHSSINFNTVSKRMKSLPVLGSVHSSDILNIYGGGDLTDYLINFATNLDPNGGLSPRWPQYNLKSPQLMTLVDSQVTNRTITQDAYRVEEMELLTNLSHKHHF